jgi:Ca-activated chloride channel homolog
MDAITVRTTARRLAIVAAVTFLTAGTGAQQVFRGGTDAVSLNVTVTDARGHLVAGLEKEDFQVYEDNVLQDIDTYTREPQPIALSLVIDTSTSMEFKLPIAQDAAIGFVRRMTPKDTAQVIDFDSQAKRLIDFTPDQAQLEAAIRKTEFGGSTSLYNAVYTAISDLKRVRQESGPDIRRQAIVLLSDGEDTSSIVTYEDVLDLAKRSEIVIYAIGLQDKPDKDKPKSQPSRGWNEAQNVMKTFSAQTGGKAFFPTEPEQLPGIYGQIADELANQYTIGYLSKNQKRDGLWRNIFVKTTRPNMTARTKAGYFGPAVRR